MLIVCQNQQFVVQLDKELYQHIEITRSSSTEAGFNFEPMTEHFASLLKPGLELLAAIPGVEKITLDLD
jgi:hypothetical protein